MKGLFRYSRSVNVDNRNDIEIKYGCGHEKPGSALEYGNITNKTIFTKRIR